MSANAQEWAVQCTTPMPQTLTQPSHAPPTKKPLPQPAHHLRRTMHDTGGEHAAGRHDPGRNGMSANAQDGAFLCITPMPYVLTQPLHALPKHAIRTTVLTGCDEGKITRDGNTRRGDITHERKEGQQVHKMGQVCAPHPCHSSSHNSSVHCQKTPFAQPNSRPVTKEP